MAEYVKQKSYTTREAVEFLMGRGLDKHIVKELLYFARATGEFTVRGKPGTRVMALHVGMRNRYMIRDLRD